MTDPLIPPASPLLTVQGATRRLGRRVLWHDLSFAVQAGEVVLVAGANGAGKTTLLRTCAGLARPNRGRILLCGGDPYRDRTLGRHVGYLGHATGGYRDLTARENLQFLADLHGVPRAASRIALLLERVGLGARGDDRVGTFSRGMVQRLAIARLVLHQPAVLLLDEPFAGLDAGGGDMLRHLLRERATDGAAILCVTHDPGDLWGVATRCLVLGAGGVLQDLPCPPSVEPLRQLVREAAA